MTFHSELFLLTSHLNLSQLAVVLVGGRLGRRHLCRICFAGNRGCGASGRRRRGREHCVYNGDVLMRRVREHRGCHFDGRRRRDVRCGLQRIENGWSGVEWSRVVRPEVRVNFGARECLRDRLLHLLRLDWVDVTSGLYLFAVVCGADDEQERMAVAERWRNEVVTTDSEEGVSAKDKGLLSLSEEVSGLLLIFVN